MDDRNSTLVIFLLSVGIVASFFLANGIRKAEVTPEAVSEVAQSTSSITEETETESTQPKYEIEAPEMPETAFSYEKFTGTVGYKVVKELFQKPQEEVVGSTDIINGKSWFDPESKNYYLSVVLDFNNIKTDDENRDTEVLKLFNSTEILVELADENNEEILLEEPITLEIPVFLTINNVQRSELFEIEVTLNETEFNAIGSTQIKMSDFGIEPPDIVNVVSVEDSLEIFFDIVGSQGTPLDEIEEVTEL